MSRMPDAFRRRGRQRKGEDAEDREVLQPVWLGMRLRAL